MAGSQHYKLGPDSYQVSAAVTAGQLVIADGSSATTVSPAGANAINVLGVATTNAAPVPDQSSSTDSLAGGAPLLDISYVSDYVSVAHGCDMLVTYAASATFGQLLKTAASGQVTPWVDGSDTHPAYIIGRCTQPGGVASGSTVARARIFG